MKFSPPIPNNNLSSACKKLNKGLILFGKMEMSLFPQENYSSMDL